MTKPQRTMEGLAKALGLPVSAIIDRQEAARMLGSGMVRNGRDYGPRYYRTTDASTGGKSFYLRDEVEQYARGALFYSGKSGPQPWPSVPPTDPVDIAEQFSRQELQRRAFAYRAGTRRQITEEKFYAGRRIHIDLLSIAAYHTDIPELNSALTAIAKEITGDLNPDDLVAKFVRRKLRAIIALEDLWMVGNHGTLGAAESGEGNAEILAGPYISN